MSGVMSINLNGEFSEESSDKTRQEHPVENVTTEEDLEVYRRADRFNKLQLISGNTIDEPIDSYVKKHYGKLGVARLAIARFLLQHLNYVAADDVLLMLSCTSHAKVIIATAGAGKTTSLQLDLIVSKLVDCQLHCYHLEPLKIEHTEITVPVILYLNYNRHNVDPIYARHSNLVARVNSAIVEHIDDSIESSTLHSFCHRWLSTFSEELKLGEIKIITDEQKQKLWDAIIKPRIAKYYEDEECEVAWELMDELYTYKVESMMDWPEFFASAKFIDSGVNDEFAEACITKYQSLKRMMKQMDFTDYVLLLIDVLREHPALRERVQNRYKIIIADENQDFTALMNALLMEIYNPEKNYLIAVGDPDQTIYEFRGVSPDNVVNLVENLKDNSLLGLDTNYRCPENIVASAKAILNMNVMRFKKPIKTVRSGGLVIKHPVNTLPEQTATVLGILQSNGEANYGETVVTYRNNKSSIIIGEELYYAGIPFSVLDDRRPFNNFVFRNIREALLALKERDNYALNVGLFRFLPMSKEAWTKILDYNKKQRRGHLHDLLIPMDSPKGTKEAWIVLMDISLRVVDSPCSDYIMMLVELYRKYYFDYLAKNPNPTIGDSDMYALLLDRTIKFWNRPQTFDYMVQELRERNVDRPNAVTLSTFHGLKGLEFNTVIAIDFVDSIFPNFFSIEQRYPENTAIVEKEAENRLAYVLVTRAKKDVHLIYLANNPSAYVDILCGRQTDKAHVTAEETINLGSVVSRDLSSAKLDFVKRMTGRR